MQSEVTFFHCTFQVAAALRRSLQRTGEGQEHARPATQHQPGAAERGMPWCQFRCSFTTWHLDNSAKRLARAAQAGIREAAERIRERAGQASQADRDSREPVAEYSGREARHRISAAAISRGMDRKPTPRIHLASVIAGTSVENNNRPTEPDGDDASFDEAIDDGSRSRTDSICSSSALPLRRLLRL